MTRSLTVNHAESVAKAKGSSAETIRGGMSAVDLRKTLYRNSESKKSRCLRLRIFLAARTSRRWTTAATTNAIVTMHTKKQDLVQFVEQVARNAYP
ncbi:hypothetical protein [Alistipes putredinis]|uniref:hypothetical protein n=1 Tax=Alistipes putredinis TaxID=28117 RepID=UPI0039959DD1